MKLFIKNNDIDLEAPIYLLEGQKEKFIEGMKKIFGNRLGKVKDIIELRKEMGKVERHPIKFTNESLQLLANPKLTNEEIASKLGKTEFAIQMKRGNWLIDLQE